MSHATGTVQTVDPVLGIGPDHGDNTVQFTPDPPPPPLVPPGGIKFVLLHFVNAALPPGNRLEVQLGYGTDVFTEDDGTEFWTRPVDVAALGGSVPIEYVPSGAASGGVQLVSYGRGERHEESLPNHDSYSNSDPFLVDGDYTEPQYDPYWFCGTNPTPPPNWEDVVCIPAGDIRKTVAASVCILVDVHGDHVSTCSGTLIAPDLVITAGHCVDDPDVQIPTMSVTFDYETQCGGGKPMGYAPVFHKVLRAVEYGTLGAGPLDYMIVQIRVPDGGLGIPPIPMRTDLPPVGTQVFGIHHPNGAVKKVSRKSSEYATVTALEAWGIRTNIDVSGGSSGSGLFDATGQFVGVLSNGGKCNLSYAPSDAILNDIAATPVPAPERDVMVVFDRSGSMSMDAGTGQTKMEEARDAASLFVRLLREQAGHRIGLVSFSTTASNPVDYALKQVNDNHKEDLVGPSPYTTGIVGDLTPDGNTTIGGGLAAAVSAFPAPTPNANERTILLLTDGLQNTSPMIENVTSSLEGTDLSAIGFGTESSLNGALLTQLAQSHDGIYMRAGDGLDLKKFFALAFGDIFEAGTLSDPPYVLGDGRYEAEPIPFQVCEETRVTVVLGWESVSSPLWLTLETPSGKIVGIDDKTVEGDRGRTWAFMRLELPHERERDGTWKIRVFRPRGGGEFPGPAPEARFFVTVLATGGPVLRVKDKRTRYFTGDRVNPLVALARPDGYPPHDASVSLVVTRPTASVGTILSQSGLRSSTGADAIPPRFATLQQLEKEHGGPLVPYEGVTRRLYDDGTHEDGAMEPDGVFGNPWDDLLLHEGNYTFRAVATFGHECSATREVSWSVHVAIGIDPGKTGIDVRELGTLPDGRTHIRVSITPRDRYGNALGPGCLDELDVQGQPGTEPIGETIDAGNGTYEQDAAWDPGSGEPPRVGIAQPGRPAVVVEGDRPADGGGVPTRPESYSYSVKFLCGRQSDGCCHDAPLVPGSYATEVNVHNPADTPVEISLDVIPLVLSGAPVGRAPETSRTTARTRLTLAPHEATMIDCRRVLELLLGAVPEATTPLTIAFVEVIADAELAVTAVRTLGGDGGPAGIDVERVPAQKVTRRRRTIRDTRQS